jgi:hypothetical protein
MALAAASVVHADTVWTNTAYVNINSSAGWNNGVPNSGNPGTIGGTFTTKISNANKLSGLYVTFNDSASFTNESGANMIWNGGSVTLNDNSYFTTKGSKNITFGNNTGVSILNINGDAYFDSGRTTLGNNFADQINQSGGTANIRQKLSVLNASTYTLSGGDAITEVAFDFDAGAFTFTAGSTGVLMVNTNAVIDFNTHIAAGNILKDAGDSWVFGTSIVGSQTYDTLSVIPEPATLGLLAAAGAGMIWIRRRFKI